jgi:hypothetical protein
MVKAQGPKPWSKPRRVGPFFTQVETIERIRFRGRGYARHRGVGIIGIILIILIMGRIWPDLALGASRASSLHSSPAPSLTVRPGVGANPMPSSLV